MDTLTFEELYDFQKKIKDAMDANTLITVKDSDGDLELVYQSIDGDLQEQLRETWKRVYLVMERRYPDNLPHKVKRV